MRKFLHSKVWAVGIAMFAMFFGSGNLVFPLMLGRDVGDKVWYGMAGLFITAVLMPLIGVVAMVLFDGNYKTFLGRLGPIPATLVAIFCLSLIGPFGIAPRCVALSYAAIKWHAPTLSLLVFSFLACIVLYACTIRRNKVLDLLGRVLGPLKLGLLSVLIIKGLFAASTLSASQLSASQSFLEGFFKGYGTLDLVAAIFFSSLLMSGLRSDNSEQGRKTMLATAIKAGIFGSFLLGIVYVGFVFVAALHSQQLATIASSDIFSALAVIVLGHHMGLLANITFALACMTTAIAVTTVFADYLHKDLLRNRMSYKMALITTLVLTFCFANLGFSGIMQFLGPLVEICYPALIVLALINIAHKLWGLQIVKLPVFITFIITVLFKVW